MEKTLLFICLPLGAYLLGSIPWALILGRIYAGIDIRRHGSGNVGASNVRRLAGNRLGLVTLLLDAAKGALPAGVSLALESHFSPGQHDTLVALVALAAVCGHLFPVYLGFRPSGKGVATAAGVYLIDCPAACLISAAIFAAVVKLSKRVSPGSLAAAAALPPAVWLFGDKRALLVATWLIAALIIYRHKDNIKRLLKGQEPRLGS